MFSQKTKGMISTAVNMTGTRAWPAWTDPAPVTNMSAFTLEALVNPTVSRTSGSLSTIMGIEGKFLVRLGDVGIPLEPGSGMLGFRQTGHLGVISRAS